MWIMGVNPDLLAASSFHTHLLTTLVAIFTQTFIFPQTKNPPNY